VALWRAIREGRLAVTTDCVEAVLGEKTNCFATVGFREYPLVSPLTSARQPVEHSSHVADRNCRMTTGELGPTVPHPGQPRKALISG